MFINPISYPGNKNKLLSQIMALVPDGVETFVDVFCGSGVVGVNSDAQTIVANDISKEALAVLQFFYDNSFKQIVSKIEKIIRKYDLTYSRKQPKGFYVEYKHEGLSRYNKAGYDRLKQDYNTDGAVDKLVVLLIYGFNHYIRFNKDGVFNVPVGKVDFSESIYCAMKDFVEHIKTKTLVFSNKDFRDVSLYNDLKAVYYFDPPYLITTAPYNQNWQEKDEKDLLQLLDNLDSKGIKFMLSNVLLSNGKENTILKKWSKKYTVCLMRRQYRNANYQKVNVTDTIEVLIKNF